jgi:hypothetical protein
MRVIKAVRQNYQPTLTILALLEDFRLMVNDCLRTGLKFEEENHTTPSMKRLSLMCYSQLKKYEVYSAYRLTAISKAAASSQPVGSQSRGASSRRAHMSPDRSSYHVTVSRFKMAN